MPDSIHRVLKSRAALAGMSLSDYLLDELRLIAGRPVIVADASAVIEVLLNTVRGKTCRDRLFRRGEIICAPCLLDVEVVQVLRRYTAHSDISAQRGFEAIEDYRAFPITRYPHEPFLSRMWELCHNLTAYDAAYICLAEILNAPVVTCDSRLAGTHNHAAAVELIE